MEDLVDQMLNPSEAQWEQLVESVRAMPRSRLPHLWAGILGRLATNPPPIKGDVSQDQWIQLCHAQYREVYRCALRDAGVESNESSLAPSSDPEKMVESVEKLREALANQVDTAGLVTGLRDAVDAVKANDVKAVLGEQKTQLSSIEAEVKNLQIAMATDKTVLGSIDTEIKNLSSIQAEVAKLSSIEVEMSKLGSIEVEMSKLGLIEAGMAKLGPIEAGMAKLGLIQTEVSKLSSIESKVAILTYMETEIGKLDALAIAMPSVQAKIDEIKAKVDAAKSLEIQEVKDLFTAHTDTMILKQREHLAAHLNYVSETLDRNFQLIRKKLNDYLNHFRSQQDDYEDAVCVYLETMLTFFVTMLTTMKALDVSVSKQDHFMHTIQGDVETMKGILSVLSASNTETAAKTVEVSNLIQQFVQAEAEKSNADRAAILQALKDLDAKVGGVQEAHARTEALAQEFKSLKDSMAVVLEPLTNHVLTLQTTTNALETAIESRVGALGTTVSAMDRQVGLLLGRMNKAENDIEKIKKDADANQTVFEELRHQEHTQPPPAPVVQPPPTQAPVVEPESGMTQSINEAMWRNDWPVADQEKQLAEYKDLGVLTKTLNRKTFNYIPVLVSASDRNSANLYLEAVSRELLFKPNAESNEKSVGNVIFGKDEYKKIVNDNRLSTLKKTYSANWLVIRDEHEVIWVNKSVALEIGMEILGETLKDIPGGEQKVKDMEKKVEEINAIPFSLLVLGLDRRMILHLSTVPCPNKVKISNGFVSFSGVQNGFFSLSERLYERITPHTAPKPGILYLRESLPSTSWDPDSFFRNFQLT